MAFLNEYNDALSCIGELSRFIEEKGNDLFDYYGLINHSELERKRRDFEQLSLRFGVISGLDFSVPRNEAYLNLLLLTSIRLGERFVFERFYKILKRERLSESLIIEASSYFMLNVDNSEQLLGSFPKIMELLEASYLSESDSDEDVLACLVNYYALFANDFYEFALPQVERLRKMISKARDEKEFTFLENNFLDSVLKVELICHRNPYLELQHQLDGFLGRTRSLSFFERGYLIESDTEYAIQILEVEYSLENILRTNKILYSEIKDDRYFNSLGRGINVLESEEQLLAYMYAYGKMHIAKINRAVTHLPSEIVNSHVVDWGCGQGLATMVFLEAYGAKTISTVTLIEPSKLSLKRAALHIEQQFAELNTINKDFDSLTIKDFNLIDSEGPYVHLFSNILDVDLFSLKHLTELVIAKFKGTNYFVISSPFISSLKTARIDSFIDAFKAKFQVEVYYKSEKQKGEWQNGWTKVIRVLKVEII